MLCFTLRANVLITPVKLLTLAARALIPILVASCSIQSRLHVCVCVCAPLKQTDVRNHSINNNDYEIQKTLLKNTNTTIFLY